MVTLRFISNSLIYPLEKEERIAIAKILLEDKYGLSKSQLLTETGFTISMEELNRDIAALNAGVPVQQLVGFTYFLGHKINVNTNVLIPRPETEELVSILLQEFIKPEASLKILDIGTGSACIPISLKKALPHAQVFAWDVSKKALEMARTNASNNKVNITFKEVDILKVGEYFQEPLDLIVSNPPYVRELEKSEMSEHVLDHEPHLALFVHDDQPLIFYQKIASFAFRNLKKGGLLAFEINSALGNETQSEVKKVGFQHLELRKDIFGKDRFIFAKK